MAEGTCPVVTDGEPCGRPVRAQGLCNGHYKRRQATGDVRADVPLQKKRRGRTEKCSRPDCGEPYMAKGLCKKHYMEDRAERLERQTCSTEGCENPQGQNAGL